MKKLLLSMVLAVAAPFAWAQVSETTTTTTTTEGNGTITEYPGQRYRAEGEQRTPHLSLRQDRTYVTRSGKCLMKMSVRTRVKVEFQFTFTMSGQAQRDG